jgi:hypothetical protein
MSHEAEGLIDTLGDLWADGQQQLDPAEFDRLYERARRINDELEQLRAERDAARHPCRRNVVRAGAVRLSRVS